MSGGPTKLFKGLGFYAGRRRDWNPLVSPQPEPGQPAAFPKSPNDTLWIYANNDSRYWSVGDFL
jgi:hypothetical protein